MSILVLIQASTGVTWYNIDTVLIYLSIQVGINVIYTILVTNRMICWIIGHNACSYLLTIYGIPDIPDTPLNTRTLIVTFPQSFYPRLRVRPFIPSYTTRTNLQ